MEMLPPEVMRGIDAETRFFDVMATCHLPPWIEEVRQVTARYDVCGVDAIIAVRRQDGVLVDVPVQIKSSHFGVSAHLRHYGSHWFARVVFVVVNETVSDTQMVDRLLSELRHVRMHRYDFEDFFYIIDITEVRSEMLAYIEQRAEIATERRMANG